MKKLDDLDREILKILGHRSLETNKAIAKELGSSEPTIAQRINGLIEHDLLRIATQWNARAIGLHYAAYVYLDVEASKLYKLGEQIAKRDEVLGLTLHAGKPNLIALILVESFEKFREFVDITMMDFKEAIVVDVVQVHGVYHENRAFSPILHDYNFYEPPINSPVTVIPLDDFDVAYVKSIYSDARRSGAEIARELGASEKKVRQRRKRLIDAGVISFSTMVNPVAFVDSTVIAIVYYQLQAVEIERIIEKIKTDPNALMVARISGRFNLQTIVYADNLTELSENCFTLMSKIKGLKDYSILPIFHSFSLDSMITLKPVD